MDTELHFLPVRPQSVEDIRRMLEQARYVQAPSAAPAPVDSSSSAVPPLPADTYSPPARAPPADRAHGAAGGPSPVTRYGLAAQTRQISEPSITSAAAGAAQLHQVYGVQPAGGAGGLSTSTLERADQHVDQLIAQGGLASSSCNYTPMSIG